MKRRLLGVFVALLAVLGVCAQPALKKVQIHLVPDHEDAIYKVGETAKFKVIALDCGVFYAFGYNDITCGPTTSSATYNVISAPKQVVIGENQGHWLFPEHFNSMWEWMIKELNK